MKIWTFTKWVVFVAALAACWKGTLKSAPISAAGPAPKARPQMSELESRMEGSWKLQSELTQAEIYGGVPDRIRFTVQDDASREMEYCDLGGMKGRSAYILENDKRLEFQIFVPVEGVGTMPRFFSVEILSADKNKLRIEGNGRVYEYTRIGTPLALQASSQSISLCSSESESGNQEATAAL